MVKHKIKEPYWNIIKHTFSDFLKSETSTQGGKLNLIFGFFLFIITMAICCYNVFELIIAKIFPQNNFEMPWYGIIIIFGCLGFYFYFCSSNVIKIGQDFNAIGKRRQLLSNSYMNGEERQAEKTTF